MSRSAPPKPPAEDTSRNEYIPAFISKAPFWAEQSDSDYLEHQRTHAAPKDTLDKAKWYDRGKKLGPAATKYRKGACENCGAMTHKTKECLSRPRKTGAKWSGRDIQADEVVDSVSLGWDAKRDRWNGYDAREYDQVVKDYEELENLKKDVNTNGDSGDKYAEETDMGRNQSTSTRQLRLREDTAGFLLDLTGSTEAYNPKTRTLDTGTKQITNTATSSSDLASEGFVRPIQGKDAEAFQRAQRYAWETQENPDLPSEMKVHLQANPTAGALLMKKHEEEVAAKKASQKAYLLGKYGDSASLTTQTRPTSITASESYVEYDDSGAIKGQPVTIPKSKYPEDVYPNNHTSVFGSYWNDFKWGYACCGSFVKNSYCTGEEGRRAFEEEAAMRTGRKLIMEGGEDGGVEEADVNSGQSGEREGAEKQRKRPQEDAEEGANKRSKLDESQ
jgi:pre-mRNA-processing factor SLU7